MEKIEYGLYVKVPVCMKCKQTVLDYDIRKCCGNCGDGGNNIDYKVIRQKTTKTYKKFLGITYLDDRKTTTLFKDQGL